MATVKKAAVKKTAVAAPAPRPVAKPKTLAAEVPETEAQLADAYLADRVYAALLERGEPAKISEITLEIDNARITFPLVRRALDDASKFALAERQWSLAARYLDTSRPVERTLMDVVRAAGRPLDRITLATELSEVYRRDASNFFALIDKVVQNPANFFKTKTNEWGLVEWLPLVDGEELIDLLFDNEVARETLTGYAEFAKGVDWSDPVGATVAIASKLGVRALPNRVVGILAWQALGEKFDPRAHFVTALADDRLTLLTGKGGRWLTREAVEKLERNLEERAASLADEEHEEPAAPAPVAVAPVVEEVAGEVAPTPVAVTPEPVAPTAPPLEVSEAELKAMEVYVVERGNAVDAVDLLALQYEVTPGDPSFASDLAALTEKLKGDARFLYVGAGRFREPESLPPFVHTVPEFLSFPELQFVSMDGEIMDEEIEDEGFIGTLRQDYLLPLAQDVSDDEGSYTGGESDESGTVRCVVKAHHKEIGTFPLCQIPDGFFPGDANIVEVTLRDDEGGAHDILVNHELRLLFGFFGLYEKLAHEVGGVFTLKRGAGGPSSTASKRFRSKTRRSVSRPSAWPSFWCCASRPRTRATSRRSTLRARCSTTIRRAWTSSSSCRRSTSFGASPGESWHRSCPTTTASCRKPGRASGATTPESAIWERIAPSAST